ncbi:MULTISPECIES: aldo/keto reductase [Rhizobium]|uniref:aldo/keto reductase n=1 Tax=Rhizobium TaxID=379 RepID=UPI0013B8F2BD|nr:MULTISPECIES: aldo/keto reductase [Rhizobium]MBB4339926.1 aryl-alcohol dehydrogenase-like predicted oxidoreductase [Rhizobium leguminosarum]MBB6292855.1 aryl-alcohol dehydrogenase-like predicted oxidoreductase [Rhizobium leguminosarum]MBY5876293.1 aldo/keto reductase [Rhizobium leguminosarum]NEI16070.1 aldo/keto reductase [Rhizobium ruizarguesonis]NEK46615.1 aldo/keto reductase [Rhizobium leguminosarum]
MLTRIIPATEEALPVIGLGTYRGFDVTLNAPGEERLSNVLDTLFAAGGTLLDSSPMYGRAEEVVGALLTRQPRAASPFLATKVWTSGREAGVRQIEQSFRLLRSDVIDLIQVHNLQDWQTHLQTLRRLKEAGRIRYIGITHYTRSGYAEVERVLNTTPVDFLQINYSVEEREAEKRLLPLAEDKGVAVLCNRPFGGGDLLRRLKAKPLPDWAAEVGATSWAQLALKFVLGHRAITCAIPGTGNPASMIDNTKAASGSVLTPKQRAELIETV